MSRKYRNIFCFTNASTCSSFQQLSNNTAYPDSQRELILATRIHLSLGTELGSTICFRNTHTHIFIVRTCKEGLPSQHFSKDATCSPHVNGFSVVVR